MVLALYTCVTLVIITKLLFWDKVRFEILYKFSNDQKLRVILKRKETKGKKEREIERKKSEKRKENVVSDSNPETSSK